MNFFVTFVWSIFPVKFCNKAATFCRVSEKGVKCVWEGGVLCVSNQQVTIFDRYGFTAEKSKTKVKA